MGGDRRERLFDEYFESSYKHGNVLTPEQLELSCEGLDRDYQGLFPEDKAAAILDFGCGVGDILYYLKKKGYTDYYGIDISRQQIDHCRKHITDRVEVVNGTDYLKGKSDRFDLITAHDVMEHIPKTDVMEFLTLAFQALKKDGRLIIRVPNMSNPFGLDARFNDFTHEAGYTAKSLYQVLWLAGFRDIRMLPPRRIPVKSLRNFVRRQLVRLLHQTIRFCYYIQDYTVPKNLDKNLVAVAVKK